MKNKTAQELAEYFKENYNNKSAAEMAQELGCKVRTIYTTAYRLGLSKASRNKFTKKQLEKYFDENYNDKKINQIAEELGFSQRHVFNLTKSLSLSKKEKTPVKKNEKTLTESQYNTIKKALDEVKNRKDRRAIHHIAAAVNVSSHTYHSLKTKIITTNSYQEFCGTDTPTPPKQTRQEAREQKEIRENTAKVNAEIIKKHKPKPKNKPNQAVNTKKSGMTTRAIKTQLEEAEKAKALKEYAEKLSEQLNAQDQNDLSVNIRVQIGKTHYILERKKYDTTEKLEAFKERKRLQEQQRIEQINQNLKKTPKQEL